MAKKKIPLLTIGGLAVTGMHLKEMWDSWDNDTDRPNRVKLLTHELTGYASSRTAEQIGVEPGFDFETVADTWSPTVLGALGSKYIGGPKGLNVNAQLRALPIFQL